MRMQHIGIFPFLLTQTSGKLTIFTT
uniref:Uncharacterized protein n=1 Tax=Moniliophthora roreri TaxID=221103 RepID=A0A0W0GAM4_MONRR